ncbi:MAG: nascent polypeptide-associated complex protein [Candidatus Micrarchaeota archaeon]
MDPRQMGKMMKQMGINTNTIAARRVIIETDDKNIIISNPEVTEIAMQGQKSYQIAGTISYEETIKEEDVTLVIEQTSCTKEQAIEALKKSNGDIAEAIIILKG